MPAPGPCIPITAPASTLAQAALANLDISAYLNVPRLSGFGTLGSTENRRYILILIKFEHKL
jgi:hypothetical protein